MVLASTDAAVGDHRQGLINRQFQHLDVFALVGEAAAAADPHHGVIFGDEAVQFFRHRTGAHEGFEYFPDVVETIAGFLLDLGADSFLRRRIVEHAGGNFDQEIVMAVDVGRKAELAHQHHGASGKVVRQQRCGIAAVIDFAGLRLPFAVAAAVVERDALQHVTASERTRSSLTRTRSEMVMAACLDLSGWLTPVEPFGKGHAFLIVIAE